MSDPETKTEQPQAKWIITLIQTLAMFIPLAILIYTNHLQASKTLSEVRATQRVLEERHEALTELVLKLIDRIGCDNSN